MQEAIPNDQINICICTYNRLGYLKRCIRELMPQLEGDEFTITVVDNNSSDDTMDYVQALGREHHQIGYVFEPRQGLSIARNTAWRASDSEWILYLDDDCLPSTDLLAKARRLIREYPKMDAFGGPIDAVYEASIPDWIPKGFGSFSMPYDHCTMIDTGFIRGGCFLIKRNILSALKGFDEGLGVSAKQLHYGEEIELQLRMRKSGFKIAYAPLLRISHFVRTEKLSIRWMLHSAYARRRDKMLFQPVTLTKASIHLLRTIASRFLWLPIYFGKAFLFPSFSFKQACYRTAQPLAFRLGEWIGVIKQKTGSGTSPGH